MRTSNADLVLSVWTATLLCMKPNNMEVRHGILFAEIIPLLCKEISLTEEVLQDYYTIVQLRGISLT